MEESQAHKSRIPFLYLVGMVPPTVVLPAPSVSHQENATTDIPTGQANRGEASVESPFYLGVSSSQSRLAITHSSKATGKTM